MYFIGVDLGTSSVKLILTDEQGAIINSVSRDYPLLFPHPGWSEQNPEDWWAQTSDGIRELIKGVDTADIKGLAVAGQMHSLVALDENNQVIRPAILWNDGRTAEETQWLNTEIGKEKLSDYTGNIAFAGFTAPKILWLKKHEPENFKKIRKIMLPKDYIVFRLTGKYSCDYSDASGMLLLDVKNKCWSKKMIDICELNTDVMPTLYESSDGVGYITKEASEKTGLLTTTLVAAGAGDNASAAIGNGIVGDGGCNLSIGTSGTIFITSDSFRVDDKNALHAFAHADGKWHLMGCMLSAASCNRWFMEDILKNKDYAGLQAEIDESKLGKCPVIFLPYLMGERSPHNDPFARGCFLGMSMDTTRADMLQAVLEGVAFGLRDSLEVARGLGINITSSRICGGGAKSPLWKRIIASALNLELETVKKEEGPSYGAAMLAAVACGVFSSVEEASEKFVEIVDVVRPDEDLISKYETVYHSYRELYPTLKVFFQNEERRR